MIEKTVQERLIAYLVDREVDFASIGKTLAKEHPELFLGIVEGTLSVNQTKIHYAAVIRELQQGNSVAAIKALRVATGYGLKDAVDVVRYVGYRLFSQGITLPYRADEIQRLRDSYVSAEPAVRAVTDHYVLAEALIKAMS
jgi:polysaccharide deacetylase 2 family uncharacterized protein YibQ